MNGAQIAQEAAVRGVSVPRMIRDKAHEEIAKVKPVMGAARVWGRMQFNARCLLVTLCAPDRENIHNAAAMRWDAFTDDERIRMGAAARDLARGFAEAQWLR